MPRRRSPLWPRPHRATWLAAALALVGTTAWPPGCAASPLPSPLPAAEVGSTLSEIASRGRLRVLCYPDARSPFLGRRAGGRYEGVDVSILAALANVLEVDLEIREVPRFDELLPALARGEADVAAGGLSISEERRQVVDFSLPYFPVAIMVIARRDSGIGGVDELTGKRGTAVAGTTHERRMLEMGLGPIVPLERSGLAYEALRRRQADFAFVDSTDGVVHLERFPELLLVGMLPVADYYAFAVPPGSDLRRVLDEHLAALRRDGLLYRYFERHLGRKGIEMYELFKRSTGAPLPLP